MKTCPYCKEEIKDDAVKCHYCQTVLLPATTDPAISDKRVILVVDRGLIYFGKFVGLALTIFIMGGLVFYGVNLREALEDVRRYRIEAHTLIESTRKESREATRKLGDQSKSLDELSEKAESLDNLLDTQSDILLVAVPLVAAIAHTDPGQDEVYELQKLLASFYEQVGDLEGEAKTLVNIGDMALQREETEAARSAYEKAIALFRQFGDLKNQARISLLLANLELQLDRAEQARRFYKEAKALYEEVEDPFGLKNVFFGLAEAEEKLGLTEEASQTRKQALAVSPYQEVSK